MEPKKDDIVGEILRLLQGEELDEEREDSKAMEREEVAVPPLQEEEPEYTPESFQKWAEERWQGEDDFLKEILQMWQAADTEEYHKHDNAIDGGLWPPEYEALDWKKEEDFERWWQEGIPEDEIYRRRDWREKGRMIELSVIRSRIALIREKYGFPPEKKERSGPLAPLRFGNSSGADEKDDE